jgi:hypothetical protein
MISERRIKWEVEESNSDKFQSTKVLLELRHSVDVNCTIMCFLEIYE